ncbi:MAG: flagellar biosynthetic protein FliO [Mariprofundaceae bacterium]|nr:flagellar biosynthetic protein FliO [Mariprofundaceae bacterium]
MEQHSLTIMLVQSVAALAGVLALFAVFVWAMKRFQNHNLSSSTSNMRVLQRLSLDSRHSLLEVQRGNKHYILSTSTVAGVSVIESFESLAADISETAEQTPND